MMNIVALGLLLLSLGSVMILSPEPLLVKDPADAGNEANVRVVKEVRNGQNAGEQALNRRKTEEVADAAAVGNKKKSGSSTGERLGFWSRKKQADKAAAAQDYDHLLAAKEKAAAASHAFEEATRLLQDATREKLAALHEVSPRSIDATKPQGILQRTEKYIEETLERSRDVAAEVKHKVLETVESAKEKISETAATAKDTATKAVERTKEAAEGAYETASATLGTAKDKTSDAIGSAKERLEDAGASAKDKSFETAQSVKDEMREAAESTKDKSFETAQSVRDKMREAAESTKDKSFETAQSLKDKMRKAAESTKDKSFETAQSLKDKMREAAESTKDKSFETAQSAKDKMREAAEATKDKSYETVQSVKNKSGDAAESTKDSVLDAVGAAKDTILENVEFVAERSKGTAANAAEKAKEEAEAADAGVLGFAEVVKEVAGKTAECLLHTAQEAGSYLPNVGQGVGYVYEKSAADRRIGEEEEEAPRSATDNASELSESAEIEEPKKASSEQQVLHDAPGGYGEEKLGEIYKTTTTTMTTTAAEGKQPVREVLLLETKEVIGAAAADDDDEAQAHVQDELGVIAQTIGWRRVGIVVKDYDPRHLTPYEIVLGDVKYVWVGKPRPPKQEEQQRQTFLHKVLRSIKGAADNVSQFLGFSGGSVKTKKHHHHHHHHPGVVGQASKKRIVDGIESVGEKKWADSNNAKDDATTMTVNGYVDAISKGKESLMEGVKAAGKEYEAGRAQAGEHANQARSELQGTIGWLQDNTTSEEAKRPHSSWKQMFVSRPRGFLLSLIRLLHLFTFSIIYGSALWVTFVSGLVLSTNLPKQQFSYMQSRIFPIYLRLLAAGELLLAMLHSLLHPWFSADRLESWQLQNFVWILVATLINLFILEPWETKLMFDKLRLEKEAAGWVHDPTPEELRIVLQAEKKRKLEEINKKLKTLHTYSSALNLLTLAGLTWHLSYLARRCVV